MIKPEKMINGTKWIETIQINADERKILKINMASMKTSLSTLLIKMKVPIMSMILTKTISCLFSWRRMPWIKVP